MMKLATGSILLARDRLRILNVEDAEEFMRSRRTKLQIDVSTPVVTISYNDKLLLLGWKVSNKTAILTCLHDEKKIVLVLPEKELATVFAAFLPKPDDVHELCEVEKWLTARYKVCGTMFQSDWSRRPKCIGGTFDEYVDNTHFMGDGKKFSYHGLSGTTLGRRSNLVVGRAIRIHAASRRLVFEFYSNGQPFWWPFDEKKKPKKSKTFFDHWNGVHNPNGSSDADVVIYAQICTT